MNGGKAVNKKVQMLRALAITAVIIIHTAPGPAAGLFIRPFANFAVGMFIFLSGYLTHEEKVRPLKSFYLRRCTRVLPPYLIWSAVCLTVYGTWRQAPRLLLTFQTDQIYYYFAVYIQLVLLTPLIIKLAKSKASWTGWLISPVSIFLLRYLLPHLQIPIDFPWYTNNFAVWFSFYYFGLMCGNDFFGRTPSFFRFEQKKGKIIGLVTGSLLLSFAEGMFWWYHSYNESKALSQVCFGSLIYGMAVMAAAYFWLKKPAPAETSPAKQKLQNAVCLLGDCSFGIYLIHTLVARLFWLMSNRLSGMFPLITIIVLIVSFAITAAAHELLPKKISRILGF